ncbi:MAG TPA: endonuclease/exonuclease/phosphatase family protein [Anaerolineales bacterium]|nr:endonuclease/exonuclease/phosphatase family protein [Anaerolineales bacterium]
MNPSRRTLWERSTLMGLALPTLVVALGLQILRVFFPSLAWYLRDTVGVGSITLGGIAFAAFLPGFLAPPLLRWLGSRNSLWLAAGGLAALRLVEQIVVNPQVDLWLSFAGTACFVLFFPFFIAHSRSQGATRRWAPGLLLGLALDTAIKGVAGSIDLSWIAGIGPIALVAAMSLMVGWLLWREPPAAGYPTEGTWGQAVALLAIGPILLIEAMILQNQGWVAQVSGETATLAFIMTMLGNLTAQAGLLAVSTWPRWVRPITVLVAGLLVVASTFFVSTAGGAFPYLLLVTQFAIGWGLGVVSEAVSAADRPGVGRTGSMLTAGFLLYLLLAFTYYVSFDIALPIPRPAVLPIAAVVTAIGFYMAASRLAPLTGHHDKTLLVPGLALALLATALALVTDRAPKATPLAGGTVRVMTYNLHSAFDRAGRLDPEAIARVIEDSGADIVSLQEVSRGWLIDASTDLVAWLSRRLGMTARFQGTADPIWGNMLLSRSGFIETGAAPLPLAGTLLPRGYVWARIDVGAGDPWLIIGTHLHHIAEEPGPRLEQIPVLMDFWNQRPRTLLMGDLNSEPSWPEMALPRQAGMVDTWSEVGHDEGLTWPSDDPFQRIDWIWHSPDLRPLSAQTLVTVASDHRPVVAVFAVP